MPDFKLEEEYWRKGALVAGVDEAGRGALAGPVVAAAAVLPIYFTDFFGLDDSKKLSPAKRAKLEIDIKFRAVDFFCATVDNLEIDSINILKASIKAMRIAILSLRHPPAQALIDGNRFEECGVEYRTIIGGDGVSCSIAAASILAKTARDGFMIEVADKQYPEYGFAKHKGYAVKSHFTAIDKYGVCPLHRKTFLKKYFSRQLELF